MKDALHSDFFPWQAGTIEHLLRLREQNRLPHALMLEIDGHEDASAFVRYLATALLCERREGLTLCRACDACRLMRAGTYADFSWVTLEPDEKSKKISKNIKIEQIRKLIHEVGLTARYDALKIAVIYPAERMNQASANALLKTLEEPARGVLLLLATHNKGRIPVTIRSRCQSIAINLPADEQARAWLAEQGLADEDICDYLDYASGDPVLALRLREQGYAEIVGKFKTRLVEFLRGQIGVTGLSRDLLGYENDLVRRLIDATLRAYCFQTCGLDLSARPAGAEDRVSAQALTRLQLQAQSQLLVEENNLDLQLQLEDVLISLKQILTRRQV